MDRNEFQDELRTIEGMADAIENNTDHTEDNRANIAELARLLSRLAGALAERAE